MTVWKVLELERQSVDDLVTVVHWEATQSEETEDKKVYNSRVYGSINLSRGEEFVPFDQLTEETVIGWVKASLGEAQLVEIDKGLKDLIDRQKVPPILKGVPWPIASRTR